MLIIRSFCIYFSIRLGSLLVGIAYTLESFVVFILAAVWMGSDPASTTTALKDYLLQSKLLYVSDLLHRISKDPSPCRELVLVISCCRLLSCASIIYGTYYMKPLFLLPFLGVELIRLVFLIFLHVTAMQIIKKNSQDLGILICATLAGSFLLCFLLYCWLCVYSLFIILRKVSSQMIRPKVPLIADELPTPNEFPPRLYPAYYTNYSSPIAPIY